MSEIHSSQGIIQPADDNAGSERKEKTRLEKNELTDCAAQFCPFECDILFQDAKTPYFLKAYLPHWFSHFRRILIISTLYPFFQSTSDSDHMPLRNAHWWLEMPSEERCAEQKESQKLWSLKTKYNYVAHIWYRC